jgi:hypothetical protein
VTRKALGVSALVVLVTNAAALGFAWFNRTGDPEAVLNLTEREVRLLPRDAENTAIGLRIEWVAPSLAPGTVSWLDATKLASLGFDCRTPLDRESGKRAGTQPPRSAYAAFEFEGESWTRYLESIPVAADRESAERGSHLVLIDADRDPAALRARHPDRRRVLVTRAIVGMGYREKAGRPPAFVGRVNVAYPMDLNVPKHLRLVLEPTPGRAVAPFDPRQEWRGHPLNGAPRYQVTVKWGRSLEPWLVDVRPYPTKLSGKN